MPMWTRQIEGGPRRVNHAAACIGDYFYSFGGYCTGEDFDTRQDIDIHRFDIVLLRWTKLTFGGDPNDIPYQRYGHTVVAYGNSCILYGGRNDINGVCEHVYKFDVDTMRWTRPEVSGELPLARDGHSCTVIGNSMYLFGGYEEQSMAFSNTVFSLNLITYHWSSCVNLGDAPQWRDFHTATAWGHHLVVFGGRCDEYGPIHTSREYYDDSVYVYNTLTQHWSKPQTSGDVPPGRRSHCAFAYESNVYIFGGFNSKQGLHFNHVYCYNPEKAVWSLCKPGGLSLPRVRRRSCCCLIGSQVYIFGGTSPNPAVKANSGDDVEPLIDLSDINILDMGPTLATLCLMAVIKHNIPRAVYEKILPKTLTNQLQTIVAEAQTRAPNG